MSQTADPATAINVTDVYRFFGNQIAVNGLSLAVPCGKVFGLIGPNGAGKSTLIRMLMGLLRPTQGYAEVLGINVLADPVQLRQRVGYVPETHHIYRWMRVAEVIGFCRSIYAHWNDTTCRELITLFRLDPDKKVRHLSKGSQVKLALTLAVAHEPELLILDEPMAGLDPIAREEFLDGVLATICSRQSTVLFSAHTLADVQRLADSVGIMHEGQLLVHSSIDQLLATTKRIRATKTTDRAPLELPPDTIWQRCNGREVELTVRDCDATKISAVRDQPGLAHVEVMDLSLEEVFKDIIKGQRASS